MRTIFVFLNKTVAHNLKTTRQILIVMYLSTDRERYLKVGVKFGVITNRPFRSRGTGVSPSEILKILRAKWGILGQNCTSF